MNKIARSEKRILEKDIKIKQLEAAIKDLRKDINRRQKQYYDMQYRMIPTNVIVEKYPKIIKDMRPILNSHGYALAVHGSRIRDLDLVAVPWMDKPTSPIKVVEDLKQLGLRMDGNIKCMSGSRFNVLLKRDDLWLGYIDLNFVIPKYSNHVNYEIELHEQPVNMLGFSS